LAVVFRARQRICGHLGERATEAPVSQRPFDPATVPTSRWLAAGGALVLLVSLFLDWFGVGGYSQTGWDALDGDKLIGVFAIVALLLIGLELFGAQISLPIEPGLAVLGCGALSLMIIVLRFIDLSDFKLGIYIAFAAAVALTAGGWLEQRELRR
jgi:hypothetical protein